MASISETSNLFNHVLQEIDNLLYQIAQHHAKHFSVDLMQPRTWNDVASAMRVRDLLQDALALIEGRMA